MCFCSPGYDGPNCENDIDECAEQPCENGGECFERSDPSHWELDWELSFADASGYVCQCQPGFAGCWTLNHSLKAAVYLHSLSLTLLIYSSGENCSVNIDECESEPCHNGATCEDKINGYTCICPTGFLGKCCKPSVTQDIVKHRPVYLSCIHVYMSEL